MEKKYKIVVYVPPSHSDILREAMGKAGAGKIGNYEYCSFTSRGISRFKPMEGADPEIGEIGKMAEVEEERIEILCSEEELKEVLAAIKVSHPYDEPATDVYPIQLLH